MRLSLSRLLDPRSSRMKSYSKKSKRESNAVEIEDEFEDGDIIEEDTEEFEDDDDEDETDVDDEGDTEEEMNDEEGESDAEQIDGHKSVEMEEIERQYQDLRHMEQDHLKNLKRHKDEDALKGQAVMNQKVLWDKNLEFRFLLQKAFSGSNKLPQEPVRSSFSNSDAEVDRAYSSLISSSEETLNSMLELQEALVDNHTATVLDNGINGESSRARCSPDGQEGDPDVWSQIHEMNSKLVQFRNSSVDKWQRRTQMTTGAASLKGKFHAFNQNVSQQVAGYMKDPSRMISRMRLRRSTVAIFGMATKDTDTTKEEDESMDGDLELIDDSEFYQQLLKEFLESCGSAKSAIYFVDSEYRLYLSSFPRNPEPGLRHPPPPLFFIPQNTDLHALRSRPKKRKLVDRRASKSRKIRYNVHEKIVSFMAPLPMVLPDMAPKLFQNLFGSGNQKVSHAV